MSSHNLLIYEAPAHEPVIARIAVAGDFLPAGKLLYPEGRSWADMPRNLGPCFDNVAASFVNLECPLDVEGLQPRPLCGIGQTVSAPSASLDYLTAIRANVISIANNHSYDFGDQGVERTRQAIVDRGMTPLGAGHSLRDAPEVFLWQGPGNIRVGFWVAAKAASDLARRDSHGVEPATTERGEEALCEMKSQGAQFRIALLHAGVIRTSRPDPEDVASMNSLGKMGFHVVAASHSHRVAGSAIISGNHDHPCFCFYGLGSLVSGYIADPLERESLVVVAGLDSRGDLVRLEVHPIWLGQGGFGEIPTPEMSQTILDRFRSLSNEIADGSCERLFYQDVSRGLLQLYARDARSAFRQSGLRGVARKASRLRMRHLRRLMHKVFV